MSDERTLLINTGVGYVKTFTRILTGLWTVRATFMYLNTEAYGFLAVLWSVFGYMSLMTFSMGFSMQKFIPQYLVRNDLDKISRATSTVFFFFALLGTVIVALTFWGAQYLGVLFRFEEGQVPIPYTRAFLLFGTTVALGFPFGLFEDVLAGLHKLYVRDAIQTAAHLVTLLGILCAIHFNGGLLGIVAVLGVTTFFTRVACLLASFRSLPSLSVHPRHIDFTLFQNLIQFSGFAYVIGVAYLVIERSSLVLVGALTSVTAAGIYQVATRLPQYLSLLTTQLGQAISPYASKVGTQTRGQGNRQLVCSGTKAAVFLLIPLALCILHYAKPVLTLWLGEVPPQALAVIPPLVFNVCLLQIYDIPSRTYVMNGGEKLTAASTMLEAILFLTAGGLALKSSGLAGFAWATLAVKALTTLLVLHPAIARFCRVSYTELFRLLFAPHVIPCAGLLAVHLLVLGYVDSQNFFLLALIHALGFVIYAVLFWRFSLGSEERDKGLLKLKVLLRHNEAQA